jgi:dTDP-4-amino-4,6-dideoxygalactose transaminase
MQIPLIDLKKQYRTIKAEADEKMLQSLSLANYIMGKNVKYFEKEFSKFIGGKYSISVANGTDALVIALKALGIKTGDEVITTSFTFFATAESISAVGAIPVFVDVEKNTFNIDPTKIEEKITARTKAIMPVHIFGQACKMDEIKAIAEKYNLKIIEDACQGVGGEYKGMKVGNLANIACFSFFPTKNLGCVGDGGMIVTNDEDLAIICRGLRTHGSGENGKKAYNILNNISEETEERDNQDQTVYNPLKYYNYLIGHNSRLDEVQATILRVKIPLLNDWNEKRRENAFYYNEELKNTKLVTPFEDEGVKHVYHMYILQSENREKIVTHLKERGIATGVYYPIPLHLQKVYKDLNYKQGALPNSEYLSKRTFAIPVYAELTNEEREYIVKSLKEIGE